MKAFVNGSILPLSEAQVNITDLALHRGYGIFDFFKISGGHVFFIDQYLTRFWRSAEIMRLPIPLERDELVHAISELVKINSIPESGIKILLTGGYSADGYMPAKPNLIMIHQPLSLPSHDVYEKGISVITHSYVREFAEAKTINYTMGIWLSDRIRAANAADVLYVKDRYVSEFPRCNFFIVTDDNVVVTPDKNVLHGVTRQNVIELSRRDYHCEVRPITIDEVYHSREAFLTSTTKRIVPITMIDGKTIGNGAPGPVTTSLLESLKELEEDDRRR